MIDVRVASHRCLRSGTSFESTRAALAIVGLVALGLAAGCATRAPGPASGAATSTAIDADEDAPGKPILPPAPQPPDGIWLTDEQGRQYFVEKIPRSQARRLDAHNVRTLWSIPLDVVREDDEYFYFKLYRVPDEPVPAAPTGPSAAELAQIEASYRVEIPTGPPLAFRNFGEGLPTSGQWREGFAIADVNGDGHLDIVHGPARKSFGTPAIFLGDGAGHWKRWQGIEWPKLAYDYGDVQVGDFDGDGHADLALAVHLSGLMVLLGDDAGHFRDGGAGLDFAVPGQAVPPGFSSRRLRVVDWDRDGHTDILALGEGPRLLPAMRTKDARQAASGAHGLVLYRRGADGRWQRTDQGTDTQQNFGPAMALADFDGDGRIDVAAGTGFFGRRDLVSLHQPDGSWRAEDVSALRANAYVKAVAAADIDGSGRAVLAVGYLSFEGEVWRTGVDVLRRAGTGQWTRTALAVATETPPVHALAFGDVDGDGMRELVAVTEDGSTWLFHGSAGGAFERVPSAIPAHSERCSAAHVEVADLDGDGRGEVVESFADEVDPGPAGDRRDCPSQGGIQAWKLAGRAD